jgi:dihydrodipicolinate synthase/N-acetylneuraminate lyase
MTISALEQLRRGTVIPAMPLALDSQRRLDERRQRALVRYYAAAGAGGLAVGVHTTQFEIRDVAGLYRAVLELVRDEVTRLESQGHGPIARVGGVCGPTKQAVTEASMARELGYHAGLTSLAGMADATHAELIAHCREVAEVLPVFGFYLQPAVGGRELPYEFWREFATIENVVAIKVAAFDRYRTLDVVRAIAESGRNDIALYTGNDDNIVIDLLTRYQFRGSRSPRRFVGGLLGQWAVGTHAAVKLFQQCRSLAESGAQVPADMLTLAAELTDFNSAVFDAANSFRRCIPGIHEVLRRQGLLEGTWCLDPRCTLSSGQSSEIDRVLRAYPHLSDDEFVKANLVNWLA